MSWTTCSLAEVTTVLSGTTPDSGNPTFWNGKHVWVTPTDLGKLTTWVIRDSARKVTDAALKTSNLPLVPASAVVMSSRAPIGHLAIAGCALHTNQGCKSFVCSERLDPMFLFFTLQHRMNDIQSLGSGATFVEVSKSVLERFEISFPLVQEQRRISTLLKDQLAAVSAARQGMEKQLADIEHLAPRLLAQALQKT